MKRLSSGYGINVSEVEKSSEIKNPSGELKRFI
jgi:hypothetical protein